MPTAFGAVLPIAAGRLAERRDIFFARCDAHILWLPQGEGIHGASRPGSARIAVAISHRFGFAGDFNLHGAAKALAKVGHWKSPQHRSAPDRTKAVGLGPNASSHIKRRQ